MASSFGVDIKKKIEENIKATIKEFENKPDVATRFKEPVIGYANTLNPMFDMYFSRQLCDHPKNLFRPGNTIIVHFLPYIDEIVESNRGGTAPSKEWTRAREESMWLSMRINAVIRETLDEIGRFSSHLNTPGDWDEGLCRESWSHKLAAYAAGMGTFGPAGSFITERGFGGRFGAVVTDGKYADDVKPLSSDELEALYKELMRQHKYKEVGQVEVSSELIDACPANAISAEGIDKKICQDFCKGIHEHPPSPEVCGKCFFFL